MKNLSQEIIEFINTNYNSDVYKFLLDNDFSKPRVLIDLVSDTIIKQIEFDINEFKKANKKRLLINEPLVGDYVIVNNEIKTISVIHENNKFQACKSIGSNFLYATGHFLRGGLCGFDSFNLKELRPTTETKMIQCWIFSNLESGAHRGVYSTINVKVWTL